MHIFCAFLWRHELLAIIVEVNLLKVFQFIEQNFNILNIPKIVAQLCVEKCPSTGNNSICRLCMTEFLLLNSVSAFLFLFTILNNYCIYRNHSFIMLILCSTFSFFCHSVVRVPMGIKFNCILTSFKMIFKFHAITMFHNMWILSYSMYSPYALYHIRWIGVCWFFFLKLTRVLHRFSLVLMLIRSGLDLRRPRFSRNLM